MAEPRSPQPAIRFAAIFSAERRAIDCARDRFTNQFGNLIFESEDFQFDSTDYYATTMGRSLLKRLIAFGELADPAELPSTKRLTNQWEVEYKSQHHTDISRPLNIDPGYVTEAKVVLATMKDRDHRLYLGECVYGEVTLYYQLPGKWVPSRWTYPDYRSPEYHQFFMNCREYLRSCLQNRPTIS